MGSNGLSDLVLSWSLHDVFNKNLYSNKVEEVPETFPSIRHYLNSFIYPLIEETHADMLSGMMGLTRGPICEISKIWIHGDYKPPKNFVYEIEVRAALDDHGGREFYKPEGGDIVVLSSIIPMHASDLSKPPRYYFPAMIVRGEDEENHIKIRALKPVMGEGDDGLALESLKKERHLYVVLLINITTSMRIWNALHGESNMNLIKMLLQADSKAGDSCDTCSLQEVFDGPAKRSLAKLNLLSMNASQMDAVLSSIAASYCHHRNSIKLIWGPPGTGKTKTVAALVWTLLGLKRRTVTCAPTNIAVLEVATRLLKLVRGDLRDDCYGLGDIVLSGNRERMKIDDRDDLFDVFLEFRVEILLESCFDPLFGWRHCVNSLIWFLQYPKTEYDLYLQNSKKEKEYVEQEIKTKGKAECVRLGINENKKAEKTDVDTKTNKLWRCKNKSEVHVENEKSTGSEDHRCSSSTIRKEGKRSSKKREKKEHVISRKSEQEIKTKGKAEYVRLGINENKKAEKTDVDTKTNKHWRCKNKSEVHVENEKSSGSEDHRCGRAGKRRSKKREEKEHAKNSRENKNMETVEGRDHGEEVEADEDDKEVCALTFLEFTRTELLKKERNLNLCIRNMCKHLPTSCLSLALVKTMHKALALLEALRIALHSYKNEELENEFIQNDGESSEDGIASTSLLNNIRDKCLRKLKFLRSECDLPVTTNKWFARKYCLSNALLIFCTASSTAKLHETGPYDMLVVDEAAQLKECESAIPLRLPGLRHAIHIGDECQLPALVKSQISADAELGRSLFQRLASLGQPKNLLNIQYRMHPSISLFPNKEFYDDQIFDAPNVMQESYRKHLLKGEMFGPYSFINVGYGREQFDEYYSRKNMVEVAIVSKLVTSLYKVSLASKEKVSVGVISPYKAQVFALEKEIGEKYDKNNYFSIRVRSVDGFQGGEDDVIILSTVRSNGNGSVGFLSNRQRTNVALTRARHCLWILGNESTLANSNSVWTNLVLDAKRRNCLFSVEDDDELAEAMAEAMIKLGHIGELIGSDSPLFRRARWKIIIGDGLVASFMKLKNLETQKKLLFLMKKLASGWRDSSKARSNLKSIPINGASSQLVELYNVVGQYYLLWTVDIVKEDKKYIQVLKFWDALQSQEIPKLVQHLDFVFGNYTMNTMNRCKFKCVERALEVPMTWEIDTVDVCSSSARDEEEDSQWLSSKLSSLSLREGYHAVPPPPSLYKENKGKSKHSRKNQHLLNWKEKNV
ncbi:hypothetical protein Syun_022443 [Stephania yunnanensis]|uniref:Helicase MAGATAMA 3 n=1 Tax=Stephania yunnanensis TaxID=152371 RepID=A0AAP0F9M1_9MAGN